MQSSLIYSQIPLAAWVTRRVRANALDNVTGLPGRADHSAGLWFESTVLANQSVREEDTLPRQPPASSVYSTAAAATFERYVSDELYAEMAARQPSSVSIAVDERQR